MFPLTQTGQGIADAKHFLAFLGRFGEEKRLGREVRCDSNICRTWLL